MIVQKRTCNFIEFLWGRVVWDRERLHAGAEVEISKHPLLLSKFSMVLHNHD